MMQLDDVDLGNRHITIGGHVRPLDDLTHRAVLDRWAARGVRVESGQAEQFAGADQRVAGSSRPPQPPSARYCYRYPTPEGC
ncbi:hypothetical protein OG883_36705 [Streptomyces sp. NBC_01142]|uniref:hypothetical protein n=1 Tax=Streptomyces sp. NBC_01142 TaxID=2975865 RepID=UPI00225B495E|nr:hypothetical protein [Streptomyces sp. NBC_01142]MCX4825307.1 hypothetical protein [Streptomyces sp. NBC_01142]